VFCGWWRINEEAVWQKTTRLSLFVIITIFAVIPKNENFSIAAIGLKMQGEV
jgi:hypothetical protein